MVDCYVGFHDGSTPAFELNGQILTVVMSGSKFENNTADSLFFLNGGLATNGVQLSLQSTNNTWQSNQAPVSVAVSIGRK